MFHDLPLLLTTPRKQGLSVSVTIRSENALLTEKGEVAEFCESAQRTLLGGLGRKGLGRRDGGVNIS